MHISLYDCGLFPLNKIIPSVIQKLDWKNSHISVLTQNEEILQQVDKFLWTFTPLMFIPHATTYDDAEIQKHSPIMIGHQEEILTSLNHQKQGHYIAINCIPSDLTDLVTSKKKHTEDHIVFVLNSESAVTDNFDVLKIDMIETLKNISLPFRWWIFDDNNWSLKSE